jgi:hypothetical protein
MRKIIQLAVASVPPLDGKASEDAVRAVAVTALCDDGSAWLLGPEKSIWQSLPEIPQGQLLQDWLREVRKCLTGKHLFRHDAIDSIVRECQPLLSEKYRAGVSPDVAAREINDRYGK